jgi:hypothetical protein
MSESSLHDPQRFLDQFEPEFGSEAVAKYKAAFLKHNVETMKSVMDMSDHDLKEIGMLMGHRHTFLLRRDEISALLHRGNPDDS